MKKSTELRRAFNPNEKADTLIVGDHQTGKTSAATKYLEELQAKGLKTAYIDMQAYPSAESFDRMWEFLRKEGRLEGLDTLVVDELDVLSNGLPGKEQIAASLVEQKSKGTRVIGITSPQGENRITRPVRNIFSKVFHI